MKVLMLGWEFPPVFSGGLGTACYGLTKGLNHNHVDVTFVMPTGPKGMKGEYVNLLVADKLFDKESFRIKTVDSILTPYMDSKAYNKARKDYTTKSSEKDDDSSSAKDLYGGNVYEEVLRFAERVKLIAAEGDFDIIHAHDWMTYQAGIEAKKISGKPLVVHIHATSFDRSGGNGVNQYVYDLERHGFNEADKIAAVSNYTKGMLTKHYGISPDKIQVVHNAVEFQKTKKFKISSHDKVVLFLGRVTLQKGPEYFMKAAKIVIDHDPDVKIIFAGSGDMDGQIVELAAELGIANKVLFAGFLRGDDVSRAYQMADVYVMPSVSEPFGITPLESMKVGTPVIISRQSGVSEVINHVLKVDFWDVEDLANKIYSVINYRSLHHELKHHGSMEVNKFNWDIPAEKCVKIYEELLN